MRRLAWALFAAALVFAADTGGIRPRGDAADYPAHQERNGVAVAAAVIPPEEVGRRFETPLNRAGYVVIEVAVYPKSGETLDLASRDFLLRVGSDPTTVRPDNASLIASKVGKKDEKPEVPPRGNVHVYTGTTIGYETGTYGDPRYGGRRTGGVYTDTSVGVGIGDPGPAPSTTGSSRPDRSTVRQELSTLALPEGKISESVAGYLYFLKPPSAKKKNVPYNLTWYGPDGQVQLTIPAPAK